MTFDEVVAQGEKAIDAFVTSRAQESLQLEFKATNSNNPWIANNQLTDGAKKVLGKALSGFANSAGGILVLGVDARRGKDGIDAATAPAPFSDIRLVESLVNQACSDLLQPKHSAIRVASIPTAADPSAGYIIVDIPRSERRPHRSEASGQKQYFKRTTGSTFIMEHYDVEDAFRRSTSPEMELRLELAGGMRRGAFLELEVLLKLHLVNTGESSAKHPSIRIRTPQGIIAGTRYGGATRDTIRDGSFMIIPSDANFVVHPGERRLLETLSLRVTGSESRVPSDIALEGTSDPLQPISMDYWLYAEGMRATSGVLNVSVDDVAALLYR